MDIKITINTDNAAFEDQGTCTEVVQILHQLATDIDFCDGLGTLSKRNLRDINGNNVGSMKVTE